MPKKSEKNFIPAIKVKQWVAGWDDVEFSEKSHRRKPKQYFFVFSLSAKELRRLSGIARRQTSDMTPRAADLGIQRQHDKERSEEIAQFVEFGYPWSTLSAAKRSSEDFLDLRKPGWLPTAIVVNILLPNDERRGSKVANSDIVTIHETEEQSQIQLPYTKGEKEWQPKKLAPIEVIDGQHRLWAFDKDSDESFELPVVAFEGLDVSWQAYLFWTINIKPKRINPSLAFDLYPLLRAEDWLDRAEGHPVYRETRSQELVEAIWSHTDSPWYDKINMLGERKSRWVTQSAWVRSLLATVVRPWRGRGTRIGGLFGSRLSEEDEVLGWSRAQQAAFLIFAWNSLKIAIEKSTDEWANRVRADYRDANKTTRIKEDPAFYGQYSLIVTDQGVRGYLHVLNDMTYIMASRLKLPSWQLGGKGIASDSNAVTIALKSIEAQPLAKFVVGLTEQLASFDWRTSAAPDLSEEERRSKLVFRGSSGYREIRIQLLEHLSSKQYKYHSFAARIRKDF